MGSRVPAQQFTSPFTQELLKSAGGATIEDLTRNFIGKRYGLVMSLVVTDEESGKQIFNTPVTYSGVPYPFVVAVESALVTLLQQLTQLGQDIATAGNAEGGVSPTP